MSGSLTRACGENVPGIPGACASTFLRIWQEANRWSHSDLCNIKSVLQDVQSEQCKKRVLDTLVSQLGSNSVVHELKEFLSQALDRVCSLKSSYSRRHKRGPRWYDRELRDMRSAAVKVVSKPCDNSMALKHCQEYRATKQYKERGYRNECLQKIEYAYFNDRCSMWKVLDDMTIHKTDSDDTPSADDIYKYFS